MPQSFSSCSPRNRDVNEIDDDQLIEDRILSLDLRLELNKLRVPSGLRKESEAEKTRNRRASGKRIEEISPYNALSVRETPLLPGRFKYLGTLEKTHSNGISRRFMSQRCHSVPVGIYATCRVVM
ncbi:FluG domain protein [Penicillium longicatenatum]|nr:FluG domain protein [Penicillium longicatenatum]